MLCTDIKSGRRLTCNRIVPPHSCRSGMAHEHQWISRRDVILGDIATNPMNILLDRSRNKQIPSITGHQSTQEIPFPAHPPRHACVCITTAAGAANPRAQRRNNGRGIGSGDANPDGVIFMACGCRCRHRRRRSRSGQRRRPRGGR